MTTEQNPQQTLDHLHEAGDTAHTIGYGLTGLAAGVERLIRERDEARAENERLRGANDSLAEAAKQATKAFQRQMSDNQLARTSVPREITPDELREGRQVALLENGQVVHAGEVSEILVEAEAVVLRVGPSRSRIAVNLHEGRTIVLLSDAPAPDPETEPWEPSEGDVGIVTRFCGYELIPGEPARFGGAHWFPMDGECWPAGIRRARPDEVTVVRAKVVPDDE